MLFKKKYAPTEDEQAVFEIVEKFLANADTRVEVNPDDMSYILINDSKHFYLAIDSIGINITNTTYFSRASYSANFLDLCKSAIKKKTVEDRKKKKQEIFQKELSVLKNIKEAL